MQRVFLNSYDSMYVMDVYAHTCMSPCSSQTDADIVQWRPHHAKDVFEYHGDMLRLCSEACCFLLRRLLLPSRIPANLIPSTHGSFLIRRQRGHPGFVLPLLISNSANN